MKITPEYNEVQVDPTIWGGLTYENKKTAAISMAVYCGYKKGTGVYWCSIIDGISGKELAEYSKNRGYRAK